MVVAWEKRTDRRCVALAVITSFAIALAVCMLVYNVVMMDPTSTPKSGTWIQATPSPSSSQEQRRNLWLFERSRTISSRQFPVGPTATPTISPQPTISSQPTVSSQPSSQPTISPQPTITPSPTLTPTAIVTTIPPVSTLAPTILPATLEPSSAPTVTPTNEPTITPTKFPTSMPTTSPTATPTASPTTLSPTTTSPTTSSPTTASPTPFPTPGPTTANPTSSPTSTNPTLFPTPFPTTAIPTPFPTIGPTTTSPTTPNPTTASPTPFPTPGPSTGNPTTLNPTTPSPTTIKPTLFPIPSPTTAIPTPSPTVGPTTAKPTASSPTTTSPTPFPTPGPTTATPTTSSPTTSVPTPFPFLGPTTAKPSSSPTTAVPTPIPSLGPTTARPTPLPSLSPTTARPTPFPSLGPTTARPSPFPTQFPTTARPIGVPTTTAAPTPCTATRMDALEYYQVLFEPFNSASVSDDLLFQAFSTAYAGITTPGSCDPIIVNVQVDVNRPPQQGQAVEAVGYKVLSQQVNMGGLFPSTNAQFRFIILMNQFFSQRGLTVRAFTIAKVAFPSAAPSRMPSVSSRAPTTARPTAAPGFPTLYPTLAPTTQTPTLWPTSLSPTRRPTSLPTLDPTLAPTTQRPTEWPSRYPTRQPTRRPTPLPTLDPTLAPTTQRPTQWPSRYPTRLPTRRPTPLPGSPTRRPTTLQPSTMLPTVLPTPSPTFVPTRRPTTLQPSTMLPSMFPSENPTNLPTLRNKLGRCEGDCNSKQDCEGDLICWKRDADDPPPPGCPDVPTWNRTDYCVSPDASTSPSRSPTDVDSPSAVSSLPSTSPSVMPASQPSAPLQLQEAELKSARMILDPLALLPSRSLAIWANATEASIYEEVVRVLGNESGAVEITVTVLSQTRQATPRSLQTSDRNTSSATATEGNLTIEFDVAFSVRTEVEGLNPRLYVIGAFDSAENQAIYINRLQSSGDPQFSDLTSVQTDLEGTTVVIPPVIDEPASGRGVNVGAIVGGVVGGLAAVFLLVILFFSNRPQRSVSQVSNRSGEVAGMDFFSATAGTTQQGELDPTRRQEITFRNDDEISTLEDPFPHDTLSRPVGSSRDETTSLAYDYKAASRALYSLEEGGSKQPASQVAYSEVSSNIEEEHGDIATLDETLDYHYSTPTFPGKEKGSPSNSKQTDELSFSAFSSTLGAGE